MAPHDSEAPAVAWQRVRGWVFRVLPGRVVMARPGGAQLTITGLASVVWTALDVPATVQEVRASIDDAFPEVGIEADDVDEAIEVLVEAGVAERAP